MIHNFSALPLSLCVQWLMRINAIYWHFQEKF
jgi:hypothetical protein